MLSRSAKLPRKRWDFALAAYLNDSHGLIFDQRLSPCQSKWLGDNSIVYSVPTMDSICFEYFDARRCHSRALSIVGAECTLINQVLHVQHISGRSLCKLFLVTSLRYAASAKSHRLCGSLALLFSVFSWAPAVVILNINSTTNYSGASVYAKSIY